MADPTELFLATMFSGEGYASTETGMLVASSTDGVSFRNICDSTEPLYTPEGGLRDPMLLYWRGEWYVVFSYGGDIAPLISVAKSSDLLNWTPVVTLRLSADAGINYIDVPQWIVDPAGDVHIIACVDHNHNWAEIRPLSPDPSTWGTAANWSEISKLTDHEGAPIVQGNTFVALRDDTYHMAYNDITGSVYYRRASTSLTSGWSTAEQLNLDPGIHGGDSESVVLLSDGTLRFYISSGNFVKHTMWFVDSRDLGVSWTSPKALEFAGFSPPGINWAQVVRITDPAAIAAMDGAGQV